MERATVKKKNLLTVFDDLAGPDLHNQNYRERDQDDSGDDENQQENERAQRDVPHSCDVGKFVSYQIEHV